MWEKASIFSYPGFTETVKYQIAKNCYPKHLMIKTCITKLSDPPAANFHLIFAGSNSDNFQIIGKQ